jgi:hypothetical protein
MSRKMIKAIGIDASVNAASWMLQVLGWGDGGSRGEVSAIGTWYRFAA